MPKCIYKFKYGKICDKHIFYNRRKQRWQHINSGIFHYARASLIDKYIQKYKNWYYRNKNIILYTISGVFIIVMAQIIIYTLTGRLQ